MKILSMQSDEQLPMQQAKYAYWIGTDYDFTHNLKAQGIIFENCLDYQSDQLNFREYNLLDPQVESLLNNNSAVADLIDQGLNINGQHDFAQYFQREQNIRSLQSVYTNYTNTKNDFIVGCILGTYRIFGIASFLLSVNILTRGELHRSIKSINEYSVSLPIIMILFDRMLPKLKQKQEYRLFKNIKYTFLILYCLAMLLSVITHEAFPPPPIRESAGNNQTFAEEIPSVDQLTNSTVIKNGAQKVLENEPLSQRIQDDINGHKSSKHQREIISQEVQEDIRKNKVDQQKVILKDAPQYNKQESDSMLIIFCVNVVIMVFPILACIYSKMIYDVKWMSQDIVEQ